MVDEQCGTNSFFVLMGQAGYVNGENELDYICELYGQGNGATGARSITVEDINEITGYDPQNTGTGEVFDKGGIGEYGNKVIYTKNAQTGYIDTSGSNGIKNTGFIYTIFTYYNGKEWISLESGDSTTVESTYYSYYFETLTNSQSDTPVGLSPTSEAYQMLLGSYWLASLSVFTDYGKVRWSIGSIFDNMIDYGIVYSSNNTIPQDNYNWIRPIVSLESNISISGGDGSSVETAYQIQ